MAYLVLARKYRPKNFNEVVHQEHVTTTLKNAISMDRVAHAHIFTGPRGTGKTTIARILAKSMNCEAGPIDNPCEECRSCNDISSGNPSDIIEIDGASNNSVDQIREIRDNLQYKPSHSRFKIYIIDEVHMLSTAAFNALLKSLEEPPPHIMFFFATTEPHKVPVTIMSRCQRHDLKRVPINILTDHLNSLCNKEGIEAAYEGLISIASAAEGSVRDSMSILDQVISSSSETVIKEEHINWILGSTPFPLIKDTIESVIQGKTNDLIETISKLYFSGSDLKVFYSKITEYLRHMVIIKIEGENGGICDLPENQKRELANLIDGYSVEYLSRLLDILLNEEIRVRQTDNIRILLELLFIKITQIPESKSISSIISRLENLETGEIDFSRFQVTEKINKREPETKTFVPEIKKEDKKEPEPILEPEDPGPVEEDPPHTIEESIPVKDPEPESSLISQDEPQKEEENKKPEIDYSGESPEKKWAGCVRLIRTETPSLGDLLETRTEFDSIDGNILYLIAKGTKYHISKLKKDKTKTRIEETAAKVFNNKNIKIDFKESFSSDSTIKNDINETEKILVEIKMNPLVLSIKDRLNAKIVDERIYRESEKPKDSTQKEE